MTGPANLGRLKTNEWDQLQDCAARFEEAWKKSPGIDLASFLPPPGDLLRPLILLELIKTDLEMRWRNGQGLLLEEYLKRFPELGPASNLPGPLVYEEFRGRKQFGDKPALEEYRGRFPGQFAEVERLVKEEPIPSAPPTRPGEATVLGKSSSPDPGNLVPSSGYKLLERIGGGGFGEVWQGEAPGGFKVAIKLLFRSFEHAEAQRELHALELIKQLSHPFLVQTHAYWIQQDRVFIVMDLADGSLRDRLKECRLAGQHGIPPAELAGYLKESAEALDYLHGEQVLHRDIKPDNILLHKRHAKVADFGLARMKQSNRMVSVTNAGTPQYMAPEMWGGKISEGTDQYCLAVTYAELRLDRRLYAGIALVELMRNHLMDEPDLEGLPGEEQQVLRRALAKNPDDRYPTCKDFAQAMEGALGLGSNTSVRLKEVPPRSPGVPTPARQRRGADDPDFATINPNTPSETATHVSGLEPPVLPVARTTRTTRRLDLSGRRRLLHGFLWATGAVALGAPVGILLYNRQQNDSPPPAEETVWLPRNGRPAPGAKTITLDDEGGRRCYDRIEYLLPPGKPVPFRLIQHQHENDERSFYLMENKVSNELFEQFMNSSDARPLLKRESQGKEWVLKNQWQKGAKAGGMDLGTTDEAWPVFRVTVIEAYCFARWLGGNLPTISQWDKAAGRNEKNAGQGPFRAPWDPADKKQVAVNRKAEGPLPVGEATHDESLFHCRDMAGNGLEWTRDLEILKGQRVPLAGPKRDDTVVLRGKSYRDTHPLYFKDLEQSPEAGLYQEATEEISFRVVIELP